MHTFSDRLIQAVQHHGPLCVGIDPRWEMLPNSIRAEHPDLPPLERCARAFLKFSRRVLDLIEPFSRVIKPQSAFFELLGPGGFQAQQDLLKEAHERGFVTILDAKRGDIASTAQAYADAAFAGITFEGRTIPVWSADALTVNPYLGEDAIEPFVSAARQSERGLFILVRTSNPGSKLFQDLHCEGKPLYRHVAEAVERWNAPTVGPHRLGSIGAVIGATHPRELAELRELLPNVWFLVPGYGAQGGSADDVKAAFRSDGLGAVINSSRGVTFPFKPDDPDWEAKITAAAKKAQGELWVGRTNGSPR